MKRYAEKVWDGVDAKWFDGLRNFRRQVAGERNVPAYALINDATRRDLARLRPGSPDALRSVRGVGERKLADLGERFLEEIRSYCRANRLPLDV